MAEPEQLKAEVLVAATVSPEQEQQIAEAFRSFDVVTRTRVVPARRGVGEWQWLVLASLPLQAFVSALASRFAEDAHAGLKRLVGQVLGGQPEARGPEQVLVLQDPVSRLQVVLEADLPTEACQQLVAFDFATVRRGPLHYDRQRRAWRSELHEWEQRKASHAGERPSADLG
jgi:hypothetical protein